MKDPTSDENMTKEMMIVVKTSKNESHTNEKATDTDSDKMVDYTYEIIEKMESKIPTYVKLYSDLYKKYLHIIDNFCNTFNSNQKEVFGRIGVNNTILTMFEVYSRSVRQMSLLQIDMTENMIKSYVGYWLTTLDFYDQMINGSITNFTKMLLKFNEFKDST